MGWFLYDRDVRHERVQDPLTFSYLQNLWYYIEVEHIQRNAQKPVKHLRNILDTWQGSEEASDTL